MLEVFKMRRSCCGVRSALSVFQPGSAAPSCPQDSGRVGRSLRCWGLCFFQYLCGTCHLQPHFCSGDGHKRCGRTWALCTILVPAESWALPFPMGHPAGCSASCQHLSVLSVSGLLWPLDSRGFENLQLSLVNPWG